MSVDASLLQSLFEGAPEGVVICDARAADWPVVFLNAAMERLTGSEASVSRGRNLRFLQGEGHAQDGLDKIRSALRRGVSCQTPLRNYRRDGTMFWNELTIQPLRDGNGNVTHFAGFHRDGGDKLRLVESKEKNDPALNTQTMMAYLRDDKLTGLLRRTYFEELVKRDWGLAQRETRRLSFLVFDLDCFATYKETFGKPGADQSLKRISRVISGCFRRASDLCGRFDEDQIAALTTGLDLAQAAKLAEAVLGRVKDLAIHHPRSTVSRYVTASAGVVSMVPPHDAGPERIYELALKALRDGKDLGRNRVVSREAD